MRKIGIMGGTFDPVHNGHLMLADTAYRQFNLDQVWFLPNGNPPHKKEENIGTDARHRSRMVALAIQGRDYCRLEEYEVRRREVSCSYQTLEHFRKQYPEDEFYFIIGGGFPFRDRDLGPSGADLPACVILAACRDDHDSLEEMKAQVGHLKTVYPKARIRLLRSPLIPVSSSEIRRKNPGGLKYRRRSPGEVEAYIKEEELYEP